MRNRQIVEVPCLALPCLAERAPAFCHLGRSLFPCLYSALLAADRPWIGPPALLVCLHCALCCIAGCATEAEAKQQIFDPFSFRVFPPLSLFSTSISTASSPSFFLPFLLFFFVSFLSFLSVSLLLAQCFLPLSSRSTTASTAGAIPSPEPEELDWIVPLSSQFLMTATAAVHI